MRRNEWFQDRVLQRLVRLSQRMPGRRFRLFSFSYTARRLFEFARSQGWSTVLGQIDPGPPEERIVAQLRDRFPGFAGPWQPAPAAYWQRWKEECGLADRVIVNSSWSREALLEEGVPDEKIHIVPVSYEAPAAAGAFRRSYPDRFTAERPLRVLFLGQIGIRKGVPVILDAMQRLGDAPVEFWFVGPRHMSVPPAALADRRARWVGPVARGEAQRYYQQADVFLFPTFSDGFGLTQLEAQAWALPIIASRTCGDVVQHGRNGLLLDEISAQEIEASIGSLAADPTRLRLLSDHAAIPPGSSIHSLASQLLNVVAS